MPGMVRLGDSHGCGAVAAGASGNVRANGIPVHRTGDGDDGGHGATQDEASSNVLANGIGIARIGDKHGGCPIPDPDHPPSPHNQGSGNVRANGP